MSLWKIAWRSIQQRGLASTLTGISMGLGVALVVAVLVIRGTIGDSFRNNAALGYNMIVGAKGGKLQLVLNTVYYLSSPVENIPYAAYKEFTAGKYKGYVAKAIPVCLGDYYDRYRVVGTTPEMFTLKLSGGRSYECQSGKLFAQSDYFAGVIGATVARQTGLAVGDTFQPTHGAPDGHQHDPFTVVGVLKPTGTPNDRALFINIEGFYLLENHARPDDEAASEQDDHDHADHDHADHDHADHDHADHDHADHDHADHDHADHDHADHDHADHDHADHDHAEHDHAEHDHAEHAHELGERDHEASDDDEADHRHDEPGHEDHAQEDHEHQHGAEMTADADDHDHADHDHADHDHADHDHADHDHDQAGHEHAGHGHAGHEHGHGHHHEPLPESRREVTAVLLLTASPAGVPPELYAMDLVKKINKGNVAQAVLPVREIVTLFDLFVGPIELLLLGLTVLIVVVAGIGILVSIYNSMSERRREIAVMRALGAGRSTVMLIVLLESILLSLAGGLAGWLLGHALIAGLNPWMAAQTGVSVGLFQSVAWELVIIPGLIVLAALVGYLPAMVAYRTDVAKALVSAP